MASISVAGAIDCHLAPYDSGHVDIDMLAHQSDRARISADLEYRHDRIADDVALSRWKHVQHIARSRL
jgi:hypothetical protein